MLVAVGWPRCYHPLVTGVAGATGGQVGWEGQRATRQRRGWWEGSSRGLGNPRPELAGLGCLGPKECLVARARAQAAREALTQPCPPSPPSIPPLHVSALATHSHKTVTTAMTTTFPGSLLPPCQVQFWHLLLI